MTFHPRDVKLCNERVSGGTKCILLAGHTCDVHLGHLYNLAAVHVTEESRPDIKAAREQHEKMYAWMHWCEIAPDRFTNVDLDTLDQPPKIRTHLDEWIGRYHNCAPNGTLIFMGPVGSGKTWAAMSVARSLISRGTTVKLVSAGRMFRSLRPGGDASIDDYTEADLLLVDDLGSEKTSDWVDETLFTIVDERWAEQRAMIVTTNLSPAGLKDAVGDRVYDRLRDRAIAVTITGRSRRAGSISPIVA